MKKIVLPASITLIVLVTAVLIYYLYLISLDTSKRLFLEMEGGIRTGEGETVYTELLKKYSYNNINVYESKYYKFNTAFYDRKAESFINGDILLRYARLSNRKELVSDLSTVFEPFNHNFRNANSIMENFSGTLEINGFYSGLAGSDSGKQLYLPGSSWVKRYLADSDDAGDERLTFTDKIYEPITLTFFEEIYYPSVYPFVCVPQSSLPVIFIDSETSAALDRRNEAETENVDYIEVEFTAKNRFELNDVVKLLEKRGYKVSYNKATDTRDS